MKVNRKRMISDRQQILQLFREGDRALIVGDAKELRRIYAASYVQHDESGVSSTRRDLIRRLMHDELRFLSMKSTRREIRMLRADVALVHGAEVDEIEQEGERSWVRYVYSDVVMKRRGRWQIVASQLAKPR